MHIGPGKRLLSLPKLKNFLVKNRNLSVVKDTQEKTFQEVKIPVPWGHISGKWWGLTDCRPVLCIHGWQDNCGTFNRIMPHLNNNVGYLAIDLPGHGFSSRIPSGLFYHSTDYIILIQYIADYFKWPKTSLLGHSIGAASAFTYAMLFPAKVDLVVCIDGFKPLTSRKKVAKTAAHIESFMRYAQYELDLDRKEPPALDMADIVDKVHLPNDGSVAVEHAHHLVERNVAPSKAHPGKYYFTRDPRLKIPIVPNFPHEECLAGAARVKCPVFICKALDSWYFDSKAVFFEALDVLRKASADCQVHFLDGKHHLHLNNPEYLADRINCFLDKHDKEDRSDGGLRPGMVVEKEGEVQESSA